MNLSLPFLGNTHPPALPRAAGAGTRKGKVPRWRWALLVAGLAAGFTAAMIAWSFRHGRLRMTMTYDDVTYCLQSLPLLHGAQEAGLAGLARAYAAHPPHGPLNSALAALGFTLHGGGLADWVPYATNALLVIGFLLGTLYVGRGLGPGARAAMLAFTLCWPLVGIGVREFRPDFYAALFTVAALWLATERAGPGQRRADGLVGAGFGLALLAKPSFFAHTAVMFVAALGVEAAERRWSGREVRPVGLMFGAGGRRLLAIAAVAGWHYVLNFRQIWDYFYGNSFGAASVLWKMNVGWWEKVAYFWTGSGGQTLLGGTLWILVALIAWVLARQPEERRQALGMLALGGLSFLIICAGAHRDSPFFALCAYVTLSAVGLRCFGVLWEQGWGQEGRFRPGRGGAAAGSALAGAAMLLAAGDALRRQTVNDRFTAEHIAAVNRINRGIADTLGREIHAGAGDHGKPTRALCTFLGAELNCGTLSWAAAKTGLAVDGFDMQFTPGWPVARDALVGNEFIVAARRTDWQVLAWLPGMPTVPQAYEMLTGDPGFVRLGTWTGPRGSEFGVFRNGAFRSAFEGFTDLEGLRPVEGPYPQWNLHLVRWGAAPRTRVAVDAPADGAYLLRVDLRANTAGRTATFLLDGQPLHRHEFESRVGFFERLELPMTLTRGRHELEIDYNSEDAEDHHTVLYRRLEIRPVPPAIEPVPPH